MACIHDYDWDGCPYKPCPTDYCKYKISCEARYLDDIALQLADVLVRWEPKIKENGLMLRDIFGRATIYYIHRSIKDGEED